MTAGCRAAARALGAAQRPLSGEGTTASGPPCTNRVCVFLLENYVTQWRGRYSPPKLAWMILADVRLHCRLRATIGFAHTLTPARPRAE